MFELWHKLPYTYLRSIDHIHSISGTVTTPNNV